MKPIFFLLFLSLSCVVLFGQKLDSIKHNHGYLYFHEYGKGEPIVILSGGPGLNCMQQKEVAVELGKKYRAILLEQRGTGLSIPTPHDSTTINLKSAHEDINRLLDHLHIDSATLYGHSWGGMLALSYAVHFPNKINSIILVGTGPYSVTDTSLWTTLSLNKNARYGRYEMRKRDSIMARNRAAPSKDDTVEYTKLEIYCGLYRKEAFDSIYPKIARADLNYKTMELLFKDLQKTGFDLSARLPSYKKNIYAICGRQDEVAFVTYELKILRPETEICWIQASGHYPMFEQPVEFYKILYTILERR
jgi:proline iminopeptidase